MDLDGTLTRADLTWESLLGLLRRRPWMIVPVAGWALRGAAVLKAEVAERQDVDVTVLPWHEDVLAWLREQKASGRELCLATASNEKYARAVCAHLGLFDRWVASDRGNRAAGEAKRARLAALYGDKAFDYAGNSTQDLPVWAGSRRAVVVSDDPRLVAGARERCGVDQLFPAGLGGARMMLEAMRPLQWAKNLLLLAPLITSKRLLDPAAAGPVSIGFAAFCLAASATYVVNDVLDVEHDRHHPVKRGRPVASGRVHPRRALGLAVALFAAAFLVATALPAAFSAVLLAYVAGTTAYTLWLKRVFLLDVLGLAGLYLVRIEAGALAAGIQLSRWLVVFCFLLFLSLALAKRHGELRALREAGGERARGRGYGTGDLRVVHTLGMFAAAGAAAVVGAYSASASARVVYAEPRFLWGVAVVCVLWIGRLWFLARRGRLHEDPLVFTSRDPWSYVAAGLTAVLLLLGIYVHR